MSDISDMQQELRIKDLEDRIKTLEYHLNIKKDKLVHPISVKFNKIKEFSLMDKEVTVKFEKLHPEAIIPEVAYSGDACFDLIAVEDTVIPPAMPKWVSQPLPIRDDMLQPILEAAKHNDLVVICKDGKSCKMVAQVLTLERLKELQNEYVSIGYNAVDIGKAFVPIGLRMEIPTGWEATFRTRSSFGIKNALRVHPGTIDSGYRGELSVAVYNMSSEPVLVKKGQGVAQVAIRPVPTVHIVEGPVSMETERGEKGFGSSDKV